MTYATDGKCHNANRGAYGHECGKPATWIGTTRNGFRSGFCCHCKEHGDEARACVTWERRAPTCECGAVLSAVTWDCVRGPHCPASA